MTQKLLVRLQPEPGQEAIFEGVLDIVGNTPLVRLNKLFPDLHFDLYAKLEALNPGGSIKDRPAVAILTHAIQSGHLRPDSVVVESSSGNMGIGLAQACRYYGLRFVCVVDPNTAEQNLAVLRAYGAEIDRVTEPDPVTGEYLQARLNRVRLLLERYPTSFWPNQYENPWNPESHYRTTMHEIASAMGGALDYLFVATSTCGTVTGCGRYVRDHALGTRIIAVDALGSRIFSEEKAERWVPGLGAGIRPPLCDEELFHGHVLVSGLDCVVGCRLMARREALLVGGSSGGVVTAVERLRATIPEGARCVMLLCDRGERYLDTVFSDDWIRARYGDVEGLWADAPREVPWPVTAV